MSKKESLTAERRRKTILSVVLAVICIIYVLPVLTVVINSFKLNTFVKTETFAIPTKESWAGLGNFIKGMTFGNYPFWKSVLYSVVITVASTALILLFTSMAAWYIARVNSFFCKVIYYLCVFSMVVPFQMVMFTLSKTADTLHLNTPWTIPVVYLGFGAGLSIFMFVGFVKSIPLEIEESASIDGCNDVGVLWKIVLPLSLPVLATFGLFYAVGHWNAYFSAMIYMTGAKEKWPLQVLLRELIIMSNGTAGDMANMADDFVQPPEQSIKMAVIVVSTVPIMCVYPFLQKFFAKGVMVGSVKG